MTADLKHARRVRPSYQNGHDRLPPHDLPSEQGVLACVLESPRACMDALLSQGLKPTDFYDLRHETIWRELEAMCDDHVPVDLISLQQRLKDRKVLVGIGGLPFLNSLIDMVTSAANLSYYSDVVIEKSLLRQMLGVCAESSNVIHDCSGPVDELLDKVERDILAVRARRAKRGRPSIKELVHAAISHIEEKFDRQGAISGLSTGFKDLDEVIDGLCPGDLIVPAALPSMGKTALSMNIVEAVVLSGSYPAAVFSLEMTAQQLVVRMMCSSAKVNLHAIRRGELFESDLPRIISVAGRLSHCGLHIVDNLESVSEITAEARRLKQEHGIKLVVVDYLQLVTGGSKGRDSNREQEVSGCAAAFKRAAKELAVPFIVPSQVTEDAKGVQSLRESKAIGQHADIVMMMEAQKAGGTVDSEGVNLWVRKNRNGPRNVCVNLTFRKAYTRFESGSKVSDEDAPPPRDYDNEH